MTPFNNLHLRAACAHVYFLLTLLKIVLEVTVSEVSILEVLLIL